MAPVYYLCLEQAAQPVTIKHNRYKVMSNSPYPTTDPSQPVVYQIRLKGHLGSQWTDWFGGLTVTLAEEGETLLTGPVVDQAALHGLLRKVRDLGMPLVSVRPVEPGPSTTLGTGGFIVNSTIETNKATATRFIEAFNTADWDTVREVVAPNYVFHHPVGGTVQAGPEGMVAAWSDFKAALPDAWHRSR